MSKFLDATLKELGYTYESRVKKAEGGNRLRFLVHGDRPQSIVVEDLDCCKSRRYTIGALGYLSFDEPVRVDSFEQVKAAWLSGDIHF